VDIVAFDIAEFVITLTWFSCGWFLVYVILGPWAKVKLVHLRIGRDLPSNKRVKPVFISHLLFSLVLVNPYILFMLIFKIIDEEFISRSWAIVLLIFYLGVLPIACECLLLRFISRWKRLRWLQWRPPLKRVVLVSLLLSMFSFGVGYGALQRYDRDLKAAIVRTYHYCVLPKGYISIDTPGVKMRLRSGKFDKAKITSGGKPVKVSALVYHPEKLTIEAKKDDNIWQIYDGWPWGELEDIRVRKNETTILKLGPPLLVKTNVTNINSQVLIDFSITGRGGEHYTNVATKNGLRTSSPELKIIDEAGNTLDAGKFEYG